MKKFKKYLLDRVSNIYSAKLIKVLNKLPANSGITLVDVGAAGGLQPRWRAIESKINFIGFEPDLRSHELLKNKVSKCRSYDIYSYALWDRDCNLPINLCFAPQVSSHYKPNNDLINLFPLPGRFNILENVEVEATKLDSFALDNIDFIKLDIQGGELNSLLGAKSSLNNVLGLEVEVEFLGIYKNQPLFGDILKYLEIQNFEFIDFVNLCRWERSAHNSFGQLIFGDALFLRSPELFLSGKPSLEKITSYFTILVLYKRFDLLETCFGYLPDNEKANFVNFFAATKSLTLYDKYLKNIHHFYGRILNFFGQEYRAHLLY